MTKVHQCPYCHQQLPPIETGEREALRASRRNSGLPLKTIAFEIGVAAITLSYWERGCRRPSAAHYALWRAALGMKGES